MLCKYCAYLKRYGDLAFVELSAEGASEVEGLCTKYFRPVTRPYAWCRGFRQNLRFLHHFRTLLDFMGS